MIPVPSQPARLALALVLLPLAAPAAAGQLVTADERAYLDQRAPLRICADPAYHPFDFVDDQGIHRGIAADLLSDVALRLGVALRLVPTASWDETLAAARRGECDVVSMLNETPDRAEYLAFTRPYVTFENVIVVHQPAYHQGLASLAGRTVALPTNYRLYEIVDAEYPEIVLVPVATVTDGLRAVSRGDAYATIVNQQRVVRDIQQLRLHNLHFAGNAELVDHYRMGVRRDDARLATLVDRALEAIPQERVNAIMQRWYVVPVEPGPDWRVLLALGGVGLGVVGFLVLDLVHRRRFTRLLEGKNAELARLSETDALTQMPNRRKIDERLAEEVARSRRYGRPLAVMLIDLDRFKEVNDRHGHLAGDRAMVAIAELAMRHRRQADTIGRWGGEEFLLLCPETALPEARAVAERLRREVEAHAFPDGVTLTVSIGVAELQPAETPTSLLARADEALYRAKSGGRNRVEIPA